MKEKDFEKKYEAKQIHHGFNEYRKPEIKKKRMFQHDNNSIKGFGDNRNKEMFPKVIGGIGEKKSNGGTQWYQQDRVYSMAKVALCVPANLPGGGIPIP